MKVLIIEDEPLVARDISQLIRRLEPAAEIVDTLSSVVSAKEWFSSHPSPDLIISDVQLSDGTSFQIFEAVKPACPIIFTTAYDQFAIRAFKVNSIDYLLKPVDSDELSRALAKYHQHTRKMFLPEQLSEMISKWSHSGTLYKERFLVMQGNAMVPVTESQIAFFHKDQLIFLHTHKQEKLICEYQALDEVESVLNPKFFFRVNRQYIIHINSVGKVKTTHKGLTVHLKGPFQVEIDISREKAAAFKEWLG